MTPCTNPPYGEVEDYTVDIQSLKPPKYYSRKSNQYSSSIYPLPQSDWRK